MIEQTLFIHFRIDSFSFDKMRKKCTFTTAKAFIFYRFNIKYFQSDDSLMYWSINLPWNFYTFFIIYNILIKIYQQKVVSVYLVDWINRQQFDIYIICYIIQPKKSVAGMRDTPAWMMITIIAMITLITVIIMSVSHVTVDLCSVLSQSWPR